MRSPRALALRAAWRLTRLAARVRGAGAGRAAPVLALDAVRRRLELMLAAVYGTTFSVEAPPPPRAGMLRRLTREAAPELSALPDDATRLRLPASIAAADATAALARYRLLAVEQAERVVRGTARALPDERDPLARDLYLLREGLAVDAAIVRRAPGFREALRRARAEALATRPPPEKLGRAEAAVERMVREALAADPAGAEWADGDAAASREWARRTAARLRTEGISGYRGVPPVSHWGAAPPLSAGRAIPEPFAPLPEPSPVRIQVSSSGAGRGEGDEADRSGEGTPGDDRDGPRRPDAPPHAHSEGAAAGSADGATPDEGAGGSGAAAVAAVPAPGPGVEAIRYPEWDHAAGRHAREAVVRHLPPDDGEAAWADAALHEHAVLVRQVRARFERLRPRRIRLPRTRDGEALDVDACVQALVERRAGFAPDDRLYVADRPARRPIAIALLVDASGSTGQQVTPVHRVIDVERAAVLLAATALDALGDLYAVLAFSGQGAEDVRVRTLKGFGERNGEAVRRRVSALAPGGFTRLGAALRHATALLVRQPGSHRLLLVLSDGRPNDVDGYQADYAVEDARMAVHEAHASGVVPFCLTVDAEEPEYLAHVFGAPGYTILRDPEQLPLALLAVVRRLLAS